jgi:hypothetical protein
MPDPKVQRRRSMARRMTQQPDDPWQDVAAVAVAMVLLFCLFVMAGAVPR